MEDKIKISDNKGGRPRKFESPKQMQEEIDAYFKECEGYEIITYGKDGKRESSIKKPSKPLTVEGLAVALDVDRKTLLNYEKEQGYEEFFPTIKKAKSRILQDMMERGLLGDSNSAVTIFGMKNNFGYRDKSELEHSGKDGDAIQHSHNIESHKIILEKYSDK